MFKKFISYLTILILLSNNLILVNVQAVETNWVSNPWTMEKANHLARKSLFWIDWESIKELYLAWSASWAVEILFPSIEWPDRTQYDQKITDIVSDVDFSFTNTSNMRDFYISKRVLDPYQAKSKLFMIFEDTFSVFYSNSKDINYIDIESTHDLLYAHTLWNYKEMIKRNLLNNGNPWDYSLWKFLDLFNQKNPKSPNENYWRELLQLFLMLEYIPTESEDNWNTRNYSEDDVNAISKILVWFESDENTHNVTFNDSINTNEKVIFLDWALKTWDSFPFYNETTWEIDIQLLKTPINWNNGLPDNTMDYIFSKRENAISMFLADKLYRFYVAENPIKSDLEIISNKIKENDFEIFPTVKWLLASDLMYTEKSMDDLVYKNPLELSLWTAKILWTENDDIRNSSLVNLGWNPYYPPNIFGRDWFDKNDAFFTAYTQTQWVSESSYFANNVNLDDFVWDSIYLTPYIWWDLSSKNSLFDDDKTSLELKSWTWSWWSWIVNLKNFNITDSGNNPITINTWSIDFSDLSITIDEDKKINIWTWELVYQDSNITIQSWVYSNSWVLSSISWTVDIDWFYIIQKEYTPEWIIGFLEDKMYLWRKLEQPIKEKLIHFLTHNESWEEINFDYSNNTYKNYYIRWLINLMLIQPEFVIQSGSDAISESESSSSNESFLNNDSKLIIIKSWGWFDFLSWVIPKDEYSTYLEYRWTWALVWDELIDLDENYYLNASLAPFKELYDQWYLKVINRVGTPEHSRWHDSASRKITSLNNIYDEDEWIIGHFIKDEDYSKTIVMGWYKPYIFRWWNYLNIWSNAFYNISDSTNTWFRDYKKSVIKDILNNRDYPSNSKDVFKNSVTINDVSITSQNNWWRAWAWYNMEDNFTFLESMFDSNVASIARMWADWWYDTHRNQKNSLKNNLSKVSQRTSDFFNRVKDKQDVTIVIFSEFWRTNKINASDWTDHGKWGWMFIISNNNNINTNLNKKVYWNLSFKDSESNWLWVWIDYRSVYSSLMQLLYSKDISTELKAVFDIEKYIDEKWPEVELLRKEYENYNSSRSRVRLKFDIDDTNFNPKEASYIKIEYWKDINNMYEQSRYTISRYMDVKNDKVNLYFDNIESKSTYFYKVTLFDNQYNETILEWSFISPEVKNNSDIVSIDSDTRLSKYNNLNVWLNHQFKNNTSSWILLWSSTWSLMIQWENWIQLQTASWTFIEELTSTSTWSVWNWGFTIPKEINKNFFFSSNSKFNNQELNKLKVERLIKVWADTLWIGMKLNKDVILRIPWINNSKNYGVLSSEDGVNWNRENALSIQKDWTNLNITTDHFTYFAIVEINSSWEIIINLDEGNWDNNVENTTKRYSSSWKSRKLVKDKCEFWDYSESYYDKTCWEDPDSELSMQSNEMTETYRLEEAIEQLREKEEFKADIFDETFYNYNNTLDKKEVLILLREKLSYSDLNWHKLVYIKWSKYNSRFKKVWNYILSQDISQKNKNLLIDNLNTLIVNIAIYKLKWIDEKTKDITRSEIQKIAKEFNSNFKKAKKRKITIKKTYPKKEKIVNKELTAEKDTVKNPVIENKVESKEDERVIKKEPNTNTEDIKKDEQAIDFNNQFIYKVSIDKIYLKADPYWKNNLGVLEKWDIVEQITLPHSKGFFKIKIIDSKNIKKWTEWYIFVKYLTK